ncbi:MAG TPA: hypothetical protein VJX66_16925 [Amycolatopsis sp.]|nr:hypothetical protein [Amycolatopsis sp.]
MDDARDGLPTRFGGDQRIRGRAGEQHTDGETSDTPGVPRRDPGVSRVVRGSG